MKQLKIKIDPKALPEPQREATKDGRRVEKSKETCIMLKDYFYHSKMRSINTGRRKK